MTASAAGAGGLTDSTGRHVSHPPSGVRWAFRPSPNTCCMKAFNSAGVYPFLYAQKEIDRELTSLKLRVSNVSNSFLGGDVKSMLL
jgi:hypothetical protein